jgi:hypothetical protein
MLPTAGILRLSRFLPWPATLALQHLLVEAPRGTKDAERLKAAVFGWLQMRAFADC